MVKMRTRRCLWSSDRLRGSSLSLDHSYEVSISAGMRPLQTDLGVAVVKRTLQSAESGAKKQILAACGRQQRHMNFCAEL